MRRGLAATLALSIMQPALLWHSGKQLGQQSLAPSSKLFAKCLCKAVEEQHQVVCCLAQGLQRGVNDCRINAGTAKEKCLVNAAKYIDKSKFLSMVDH